MAAFDAVALEARLEAKLKLGNGSSSGKGSIPLPGNCAFSPNTSSLLSASAAEEQGDSSAMRTCFAEAFAREMEYLSSLNVDVNKERQQQILADILVWAEVTQEHYDAMTRSFVLEPNQHDEAFLRVGRFLQEAKTRRGLS